MDPTTFETWLSGFASLTDLQRRSAWQALALSEAAAGPEAAALASSERAPAYAKPPTAQVHPASLPALRLEAERGSTTSVADLGQCPGGQSWLPTLRQPRRRALGPCERSAALPLQSLPAHLQRADEDAVGEVAHEGQMGSADRGDDRRRQPGASRAALRCAPH